MGVLFKGLAEASLLRKLMLRVLFGALLFLSVLQLLEGYERYKGYQKALVTCIDSHFRESNDALAKQLKTGRLEYLSVRLNGIEYSCAYPEGPLATNEAIYTSIEQAGFYWSIEKDGQQVLSIGKNMLRGPTQTITHPLSIWKEGNQGDYWVGSVSLELFFGDYLAQLVSEHWLDFSKELLKLVVIWLATYFLFYRYYIRPNQAFIQTVSKSRLLPAEVRNLVAGRKDELSNVWRSFLALKESVEVERFEFESQIRDLETHISKVERGHAGQSLSTGHASLDIKNALARALVLQARAARKGDPQAAFSLSYLSAVMSVAANLHDRAQMESGELILSEIPFNFKVMMVQVYQEFLPRLERRSIYASIHFDQNLPTLAVGDPEKLKRLVRNAFKRALLQARVESITLRAQYQPDTRTGPRFLLELVTAGKAESGSGNSASDDGRKEPEKGPTPMLEMLCYIMGARWVFSMGLDGELKQSLSVSLPVIDAPANALLNLNELSALNDLHVLVYDLPDQARSVIARSLKGVVNRIDYASTMAKLKEQISKSVGLPHLVIVSDMVEHMSSKEFVAELRRNLSAEVQLIVVSESPQIGDGQHYIDMGVQGFVPRVLFARYGMLIINYIYQYTQRLGTLPNLVTRYTVLDYYGASDDCSLPEDLNSVARGSVLLVAEELVCIEYTRLNCAHFGMQLVHYASAFEAIDAFRQEAFDVVLIDDQFDDLDALTIIQMMRQIESRRTSSKKVPIIALGSVDYDDKDHYLRVGATDVINKYTIDGSLGSVFTNYVNT
jgi:CheY-like chemotaxis protein